MLRVPWFIPEPLLASMDKYKILQNSVVVVLALFLLLMIWVGISSGKARAQSKVIVNNAEAIAQGIDYFYSDYDRFPSVLEFQTPELMDSYFEPWPNVEFSGGQCSQSIGYENFRFDEYTLFVCLPAGYKSLPKGVSEFTVSK